MKKTLLTLFIMLVVSSTGYTQNRSCDRLQCLALYNECIEAGNSGFVCYNVYHACTRGTLSCS